MSIDFGLIGTITSDEICLDSSFGLCFWLVPKATLYYFKGD